MYFEVNAYLTLPSYFNFLSNANEVNKPTQSDLKKSEYTEDEIGATKNKEDAILSDNIDENFAQGTLEAFHDMIDGESSKSIISDKYV